MTPNAEHWLKRWSAARLIDPATTDRIRNWEQGQHSEQKFSGPVRVLIGLGGLTIAASILLFVAAHWDTLSPFARFMLVASMVAGFHVAGGVMATRFAVLATTLHAVGTAALGAGIFLAAQIFNLQEHWPGGVMLWALGAWIAWGMLRDRPQLAWVAILTPAWLVGEWAIATSYYGYAGVVSSCGVLLLCIAYMVTRRPVLGGIGNLLLLPMAINAAFTVAYIPRMMTGLDESTLVPVSMTVQLLGWTTAFLAPVALVAWLNRTELRMFLLATLWVALLVLIGRSYESASAGYYLWLAVGSVGLVAWGLRRAERIWINLGVACFALTVLAFYFSTVFDKLGRSMSLLVLGLLLIGGGWALERARRRLLTKLEGAA